MSRWLVAALSAVALVALVLVVARLSQWGADAPSSTGGCVAGPGGAQEDVDASDTPESAWPHARGERVVVHVAVAGLPARYAGLVRRAAAIWARSPCVQLVVADACPAGSHCVTVVGQRRDSDDSDDSDDTDARSDNDDTGGVRRSTTITLYTDRLDDESDNGALATVVHEVGHALGLVHRNDPDSVMNADTDDGTDPVPDATDFANLVAVYG